MTGPADVDPKVLDRLCEIYGAEAVAAWQRDLTPRFISLSRGPSVPDSDSCFQNLTAQFIREGRAIIITGATKPKGE